MDLVNINGKILKRSEAFIEVDDHSYRYGDGLFETMKIREGKILLSNLHFERLFHGLAVLQLEVPRLMTAQQLEKEILGLSIRNNCEKHARVRLSVSGGKGGIYDSDDNPRYVIECLALDEKTNNLNENGLVIDIFPDARKSVDRFSNLKSASCLPYVMAARFAKKNKLDDCLLLNVHDRICDSSIANVFWIKNGEIFTPPLTEGCVGGVMRKYLLERMQDARNKVQERVLSVNELEDADEIFLTNAIKGMRWVNQFRQKSYDKKISARIFEEFIVNRES